MSKKKCPFCAEEILEEAKKCKHCGEFLDGNVSSSTRLQPTWSPGVAAVLSCRIPGLGQFYKGQFGPGISFLILVPIGYFFLIIPGLCLHFWAVIDAYNTIPVKKGSPQNTYRPMPPLPGDAKMKTRK